jgi:hypothetical protein
MKKDGKSIFLKNGKKGFELALSTIVILVLAVLLLLFAVMFFTTGSGNFIDIIKSYFSDSNIDLVVQRCNVLADSNSLNSFCCEKREVKYFSNDVDIKGIMSCKEVLNNGIDNRIKNMSCEEVKC